MGGGDSFAHRLYIEYQLCYTNAICMHNTIMHNTIIHNAILFLNLLKKRATNAGVRSTGYMYKAKINSSKV